MPWRSDTHTLYMHKKERRTDKEEDKTNKESTSFSLNDRCTSSLLHTHTHTHMQVIACVVLFLVRSLSFFLHPSQFFSIESDQFSLSSDMGCGSILSVLLSHSLSSLFLFNQSQVTHTYLHSLSLTHKLCAMLIISS